MVEVASQQVFDRTIVTHKSGSCVRSHTAPRSSYIHSPSICARMKHVLTEGTCGACPNCVHHLNTHLCSALLSPRENPYHLQGGCVLDHEGLSLDFMCVGHLGPLLGVPLSIPV